MTVTGTLSNWRLVMGAVMPTETEIVWPPRTSRSPGGSLTETVTSKSLVRLVRSIGSVSSVLGRFARSACDPLTRMVCGL